MLARLPIRNKLLVGVALLLAMVVSLSLSGFQGVYAYRDLARGISQRANEPPLAIGLIRRIAELRVILSDAEERQNIFSIAETPLASSNEVAKSRNYLKEAFRTNIVLIEEALRRYREQLDETDPGHSLITDNRAEWETVNKMHYLLGRIQKQYDDEEWVLRGQEIRFTMLSHAVMELETLASQLPAFQQERLHHLADQVRGQYRTSMTWTWASLLSAIALLLFAVYCGYRWIFHPLGVLVNGSRRVAAGDFGYRIVLPTSDEMAELAAAMNRMTERFQEIRDDLDHQVRQRTKEVVRSEQLASVGFLAAGVAHEINNPLAAIAMCSESLEMRLHDIIVADDQKPDDEHNDEITILRKYLRRIQDEAFRCKGITEKLLDFSRMGDVEKHSTDLVELTEGVIDMVRHLGKYRDKRVEFAATAPVVAAVNAQEIKQVLLNIITNGLDSIESGGAVTLQLSRTATQAVFVVRDNGCGMSPEVLKHLFEPFFTRKRDGQGTGLGLSITYRIVQDHGGTIEASSDGPGCGAEFRVTLPLVQAQIHEKRQAA